MPGECTGPDTGHNTYCPRRRWRLVRCSYHSDRLVGLAVPACGRLINNTLVGKRWLLSSDQSAQVYRLTVISRMR